MGEDYSMDKTTVIGIIAGLAALIGGFLWEGGNIGGLWEKTAALIVIGGTIAAVVVSFPGKRLRSIPQALKMAFAHRAPQPEAHRRYRGVEHGSAPRRNAVPGRLGAAARE